MIFKNQVDVNTYIDGGNPSDLLRIDGVLGLGLEARNTGETRQISREFINYLGRGLVVTEFGKVYDADTHEELEHKMVRINNSEEKIPALPFINSKGQKVYKRIIHLVAMAFLKDETPRRIHCIISDNRLCFLNNIKTRNHINIQGKHVMPFLVEDEFNHYCKLHNIGTIDELLEFQGCSRKDMSLMNPKAFEISTNKLPDADTREFEFYGKLMRVSSVGELSRLKGGKWVSYNGRRQIRRNIVFYVTCYDGKKRSISVANCIARLFCGLDKIRTIKYIDGNPANLHFSNLWWSDCGRLFEFEHDTILNQI